MKRLRRPLGGGSPAATAAAAPLHFNGRHPPATLLLLLALALVVAIIATFSWHSSSSSPSAGSHHLALLSSTDELEAAAAAAHPLIAPPSPRPSDESIFLTITAAAAASTTRSRRRSPPRDDPGGPYHGWESFHTDYHHMLQNMRIFVYPDAFNASSPFSAAFIPHPNTTSLASDKKLANYFSEHMFKAAFLRSPLLTPDPDAAHFFFLPFSVNALRNDPRVRSEEAIAGFVSAYVAGVARRFPFWNASGGSDHFYACCHSVGRDAASRHQALRERAAQVACSASYFQRTYVPHKDVAMPQVWPRLPEDAPNPPDARKRLVFFSGRTQNSQVRREVIAAWKNDSVMDIFPSRPPFPYESGFRNSKYCLHVKGYEVNTARISDAIHYGCIPVIVSNHYDLPFANVLDWSKFSVVVNNRDIPLLKRILLSIPEDVYLTMYNNILRIREHFRWHATPINYDSFFMTAYQLWLRRGLRGGQET